MTGVAARPTTASARWTRVKWTEAGQVAALLDGLDLSDAESTMPPQHWWAERVAAGERATAVRFLAMALPRLEAIRWAAMIVEPQGVGAGERATWDAIGRWIDSPDDAPRRAAWAAAEPLVGGPVRHLALAIYFSGGSIAPANLPSVPPPPAVCGTAVAGAVTAAAYRGGDPVGTLDAALAAGARLAAGLPD